ncbi:MAG: 3-phosphoshikimate 1-carboxyvinyltransferase [Planctomycetaceae bacterium]|nr:3-phosphoshikimate 1-carboxyvinyltransferase [Planctomycetaceae bacterium]MBQ2822939.1 3-phosphoshikimate 1-carboxyvinyltransferase [Thermoguttaceae bacterium]MDO4424709.1 3-phosphoshikimate 1-carboxyvinyltransferase [Planctomycetia bacterium]
MNSNIQSITLSPVSPISAEITPPGSKSITNRALAIAAAAEGESILRGALDSEDTRMMMDSLQKMNIALQHDPEKSEIRIQGTGGAFFVPDEKTTELFCGNSGTTIRFLTAMCANSRGIFRLDGVERMRQRPLGDLVNGLRQLGVSIESELKNDCPPVILRANGISGGTAKIPGNVSSQFLSGLLMAVPYAKNETKIFVDGSLVSKPYVDMTISVMKAFGVEIHELKTEEGTEAFRIPPNQKYRGREYVIEPDASAASYFFAAAAVTGGEILVRNLSRDALQGDVAFCDCLEKMGCAVEYLPNAIKVSRTPKSPLHGIDVDMHFISDTVQTLSAVALFANSPTTIRNVANMRVKETDRIHAVVTELRKFGVRVDEFDDGMTIYPISSLDLDAIPSSLEIETYRDHRMAMSFALVGLRIPGVTILDPDCTVKTYPNFFDDLNRVCKTNFKKQ